MTRALQSGRVEPLSGEMRSAVIFLHGYGANGADLLGLAEPLAEHMPDTLFLAPDAPEACIGAPMGFQWFPIPWIDGSSEEESRQGLQRAAEDLNAFLDGVMVDEDLLPEQVMVVGFSQGTMMALHVLPRREDPIAGLVAFSGRLLEPELLADEVQNRLPILLVHGDMDEVVPPQSLPEAAQALQEAGWTDLYAHVMKGTAHGIAPDGLEVALAFMRERLGIA
ncbi:phospholipase/carboxylesterase [Limimaricola variabilis]|jgi:phospholipase/carboxylesterase|uniref:Phospholipase/carboxylesterase n=1 Tax=Limimaricola variabilis TaxID=1492771 RepID=A0ABR6HKF6_9RHOB|nr:alpha/beta fold hydrolase [Limimaricola variabilis]MBB3710953.1 phospholipase/carboxylesterase [Limimaricola variabilis]WPY95504.1 alpha/beta fold hydrolase [Limimaricola variabilis]